MGEKIFQIGFNKCGTSSLHALFSESGYRSVHWDEGQLARRLYLNLHSGAPILSGLEAFDCFTDMEAPLLCIFGHRYFRQFHEAHPNSYFVLNTRTKAKWLTSRMKHGNGFFAKALKDQFGLTRDEVTDFWSAEWDAHHRAVQSYFADKGKLLVFNIEEDPVEKLIDFVKPDFALKSSAWKHVHKTRA